MPHLLKKKSVQRRFHFFSYTCAVIIVVSSKHISDLYSFMIYHSCIIESVLFCGVSNISALIYPEFHLLKAQFLM
jgi:hypothetical protein